MFTGARGPRPEASGGNRNEGALGSGRAASLSHRSPHAGETLTGIRQRDDHPDAGREWRTDKGAEPKADKTKRTLTVLSNAVWDRTHTYTGHNQQNRHGVHGNLQTGNPKTDPDRAPRAAHNTAVPRRLVAADSNCEKLQEESVQSAPVG